jgi:phosphoribosylglycinamide formyltransferase 1
VVSDRSSAGALDRARAAGVPIAHLADPAGAAAMLAAMQRHAIDLVVLAGYLKLVPREVVAAFAGRMINIHPALLPAFGGQGMYGVRVHRAVLESGVTVSGATVHVVDEAYDRGPILAQWPVPVHADDTPKTLQARVLAVEHRLLPAVVLAAARNGAPVRLVLEGAAFASGAAPTLDALVARG